MPIAPSASRGPAASLARNRSRSPSLEVVGLLIGARRVGKRDRELSRDAGIEAPARNGQRVGVLEVFPAGFDALVAEDALAVVPDVKLVVHFRRLGDGRAIGRIGWRMVARLQAVAQPGGRGWSGGPVTLPVGVIFLFPPFRVRRGAQIHRRREEFQNHLPAVPDPFGVGPHHHSGFHFPGTGWHQHSRPFNLHHADSAHIDGVQSFEVAQRRDFIVPLPACLVDRGPFGHLDHFIIDLELDGTAQRLELNERGHRLDPLNR